MNVRASHDFPVRVVLAHQVSFRLGALLIDPAMRRIVHQDGRQEIVEHRVMQVLVALARVEGDILSRDDLIARCWDGRIVGDDAINRVMSRLRRISKGIGRGVFRIETITKVGYRLSSDSFTASGPALAAGRGWSRRYRIPATVGIAALLALAALLAWQGTSPSPAAVAVLAEGEDPQGRAFARHLAADLSRLAGARPGALVVVDGTRAAQADYVVRAGGERQGGRVQAALVLSSRGGELLWSARFDRLAAEEADLRPQAAAKLSFVLLCATEASAAEDARMGRVALRLYLAACDRMHDDPDPRLLALTREITARSPDFAQGWAMRAYAEAFLGGLEEAAQELV